MRHCCHLVRSFQEHVRQFPIRSEVDPLGQAFPGGVLAPGAYNAAVMQQLVADLAKPFGLGGSLPSLLRPRSFHNPEADPYPYAFPDIDSVIDRLLVEEEVSRNPAGLVDLSAALIVAHNLGEPSYEYAHRLAYSLLRRGVEIAETCELRLQLLGLVTRDFTTPMRNVQAEYEASRSACPSDPAPSWLLAQAVSFRALNPSVRPVESSEGFVEIAEAAFRTLSEEFPDSPLGSVGRADFLLDRADAAALKSTRSFEARGWRSEALALIEQARQTVADPALLVSHARALASLGDLKAAHSVLDEAPGSVASNWSFVLARVLVLQAEGDSEGVIELLRSVTPTYPDGLALTSGGQRNVGTIWPTTLPARIVPLRLLHIGGPFTASDKGFMPISRENYQSRACFHDDYLVAQAQTQPDGIPSGELPSWWSDGSPACTGRLVREEKADVFETRQDIFRWSGNLTGALAVAEEWSHTLSDDYRAHQRVGEIHFLRQDYPAAKLSLERALALAEDEDPFEVDIAQKGFARTGRLHPLIVLRLQLAAVHRALEEVDVARSLLEAAGDASIRLQGTSRVSSEFGVEQFYVSSELGNLELRAANYQAAAEHLLVAIDLATELDGERVVDLNGDARPAPLLRGAQENNRAIALVQLAKYDEAIEMATSALSRDRANPIFLNTLAFAHHMAGHPAEAAETYAAAITVDETTYTSANNLAVLLAESGDQAGATRLLEQALAVAPEYAVAWHNLGVTQARGNLRDVLASQASLGEAGRLDNNFRGAELKFVTDEEIRDSGLDISKPLSPDWTVSASSSSIPNRFTWSMLALIAIRIAWALGLDHLGERAAELVAARRTQHPIKNERAIQLAVVVAMLSSLFILLWSGRMLAASWGGVALLCCISGALIGLPWAARRLAARSTLLQQSGWIPGVALGFVAAPFGLTLVPFPGLRDEQQPPARAVVYAATVAIGATVVLFLSLAAVTAVPAARTTAMLALALLGSILLPFPPFDGHRLTNRWVGLGVTVILIVGTAALALQWV